MKIFNVILAVTSLFWISCTNSTPSADETSNSDTKEQVEPMADVERPEHHSYGGWYCPDNLTGFPPVDATDLSSVPVVTDRLPTREETRNGTSLMYVDKGEYPDAMPIDLDLPRLAYYYNHNTNKNELIVVIQGLAVNGDSVVGFRYVNGGNGSAWLNEVDFLEPNELNSIESTQFFFRESEFGGTAKAAWSVITGEKYSKMLGSFWTEGAYVQSSWQRGDSVYIYINNEVVATGIVSAAWENLYLQLDYDFGGMYYVEKYLMLPDENTGSVKLQVVAGPFGGDAQDQMNAWNNWFDKVQELSIAES